MNGESSEILIVAVFTREELLVLERLLIEYVSPFTGTGEEHERRADEQRHEQVRRKLSILLEQSKGDWRGVAVR